ncbi:MAG: citramalate synthase, partial [Candidatus Omnitrophica bacterium]|nr:citramalate synthase [Candidatus Omnitrophota bacterium]
MQKVELYDTTLRDGAQAEGISFSVTDKVRIAEKLDEVGIHYIEGGWPGANPKDITFFKKLSKLKLRNSKIVAFGSTRYPNTTVSKDRVMKGLLDSDTEVITLFGKCWDLHVRDVLKTTPEENLRMIEDSVKYLKSKGKSVLFDAEHFFDGYKQNPKYAVSALEAACGSGAECLI